MRHDMEKQADRRINGTSCEKFVLKFLRGDHIDADCYDIRTKKLLVEVKSCQHNVKQKRGEQIYNSFGRFHISMQQHQGLQSEAVKQDKKPMYAFVLRLNNRKLFKLKSWQDIDPMITKKYSKIAWHEIF